MSRYSLQPPVTRRRHSSDLLGRVRQLHFVGIGGAGMSGIAEVMLNLGFAVSGSDMNESAPVRRLRERGATVSIGHAAENVDGADVLVVSSAIAADNPELQAAQARRVPVVPRAEMLGELMRFRQGVAVAGSHGKTTTTSLLASVLADGGLDPTFVIGGLLNRAGSNARLGGGQWLVAEADESDGSFLSLQPVIAVITNIDSDHLGTYGGRFETLRQAFADFLHRLPFYGVAVLCIDDPHVRSLLPDVTRTVLTYGLDEEADVRARDVTQDATRMQFEVSVPGDERWHKVQLNLPGQHNVQNALAALAVGWELGLEVADMAEALSAFAGVGRRFSRLPDLHLPDGGQALFVDDYGHHPTELRATLAAARAAWPERRLVLGFQPHRYSRTKDLFEDFTVVLSEPDALVLADVYPAGESVIEGADGRSLCAAIRSRGRVNPVFCDTADQLPDTLAAVLRDGDVLLLCGAGNIGAIAAALAADPQLYRGEA
jgi:UDP-N-acetylmuramate--alanine ligase